MRTGCCRSAPWSDKGNARAMLTLGAALPSQSIPPPQVPGSSIPEGITPQMPDFPGRLHERQVPPQAEAQHTPSAQCVLVQLMPAKQLLPLEHLFAHDPPQSTSVSSPFLIPSKQLMHFPPAHFPLAQSLLPLQVLPSAHGTQLEMPPGTFFSYQQWHDSGVASAALMPRLEFTGRDWRRRIAAV